MTKQEFLNGILIFKNILGEEKYPNNSGLKLYYELLKDFDNETFQRGILKMLKERKYSNMPQPAEIIEYINGTTEKDLEIYVNLAKSTLRKAVEKVGAYDTVAFEDLGIHAVIDSIGGWTELCRMSLDDFNKFMTFEFHKIYRAYKLLPYNVSKMCLGIHQNKKDVIFIGYEKMGVKIIEGSAIDYSKLRDNLLIGGGNGKKSNFVLHANK